jgi:hypothetical protein
MTAVEPVPQADPVSNGPDTSAPSAAGGPGSPAGSPARPTPPHLSVVGSGATAGAAEPTDEETTGRRPDERSGPAIGSTSPTGAIPPYRPHITERPLRRIDAFHMPRARARTAVVVVTAKSGPVPVGPDGRPAMGEIFWSGGTLYEIDLGLHHTTVELDLPARSDSSDFHLAARIEWRVQQAATVVADNIIDIREALAVALHTRLAEVTREFDIAQVEAAELKVREAMHGVDPGGNYGLQTTIALRLTADEKTRAHSSAARELERERRIEDLRHRNKSLQQEQDQARQRRRLAEYRKIVAAGNIDQFALQLARNPEDVAEVVKLAREERYEERKQLTGLLTKLFESGAVDRWDIDDQVRLVLEWLAESTHRILRSDVVPMSDRRADTDTSGPVSTEKPDQA